MNYSTYQQNLIEQIKSIQDQSKIIFDSPSKARFNIRLSKKKWSVAEHLDHMNKIYERYFEEMDKAERSDAAYSSNDNYNPRFFGKMFIKLMEPPPKIKLKTFKIFVPKQHQLFEIKQEFYRLRNELVERINRSVDYKKLKDKLNSPLSSLLRFQMGEAFLVLTAHDRRHNYAINNIIKQL